jgi:DNA-binding SARP family transcriptional activator
MAELSIRLFGAFEVTLDGEPVTGFASDKVRALLAYLVVESDRPHRREALAGLLWPDYPEASARASLRRALANLRDVIGDRRASAPRLSTSRQTVQFNAVDNTWCDVTAFAQAVEADRSSEGSLNVLAEAVDLYRGPFLEGFSLGDSVVFEEWMLLRREWLRREALAALRRLATRHEARGEVGDALAYARRQVELEPWQEEGQRQLMRLLALDGQRGLAVAQYNACWRTLADQLGVEPAVETTELYEQIRDGKIGRPGGQNATGFTGAGEGTKTASSSLNSEGPPAWRTAAGRLPLVAISILVLLVVALQALTFSKVRSPEEAALPLSDLVESPVGKVVLPCEDVTPPQICVYAFRTGQMIQVTDDLAFEEIDGLVWSPDGRQIVFDAEPARGSTETETRHIYVVGADGSGLRQVTDAYLDDHVPNWSPDGEWIAYNRSQELWLVRPDGSEQHRLFGESGKFCVGELAWAPDSRQIAFLGQTCPPAPHLPNGQVWTINRDGTAAQVVHAFERRPDLAAVGWGPDGVEIVCDYTDFDEGPGLLRIDPRGIGEPFLIDVLPLEWHPHYWPQWGQARRVGD